MKASEDRDSSLEKPFFPAYIKQLRHIKTLTIWKEALDRLFDEQVMENTIRRASFPAFVAGAEEGFEIL
jgi:hypothetical protein